MPRRLKKACSIVTLTTDFGWNDAYVAEMKAVLLGQAPDARIVDVTHGIAPQDVAAGSVTLERLVRAFDEGTVHVVVIDPGVGSNRRLLLARIGGQTIICPDNGLITWAWRRHPKGAAAHELTWRPATAISATFHGRDVMAPAAARIAAGERWQKLCRPLSGEPPRWLDMAPATSLGEGRVIHVDHFGNATTNVPGELLDRSPVQTVRAGRHRVPLRRTYAGVPIGGPLALVGSSGLLEIAVRNGSACKRLGLRVGDVVKMYGR